MKIIELLFKASTNELDVAEKKLDKTGKAAKNADKEVKTLAGAFKQFNGIGGPIGEVASKIDNLKGSLTSAYQSARLLGPALIAVAGSAGILAAIRFTGVLDEISKLGQQFGYTAGQAALLDAKLQGRGGLASYEKDIGRVARALGQADEESSRAFAAFEQLGIKADSASTAQTVLAKITEEYADKIRDGNVSLAEQQSLQIALGETWKDTIFRYQEAAAALAMYNDFANQGLGISAEGEKATADYNDALDGLSYVFKIVGSQLVGEVIPAFTGLINAFVDSYKNGGLVSAAFGGIRVASQLVMVPIRALFNAFIQLDAAITSVGKGLGAVFAAIATRSLDPLRMLKEDVAKIWETANSRTTSAWSWDSGSTAAAQNGNAVGGGNLTKPKKQPKSVAAKQESGMSFDSWYETFQTEEKEKAAAATEKAALANSNLLRSMLDLGDPTASLIRQQLQIEQLMIDFPQHAEGLASGWFMVQEKIEAVGKSTEEVAPKIDIMGRIGDTAFKGLEDSLMSLANNGTFSFKGMVSSMLSDIARLVIQLMVVKPLLAGITSMMGGGSFTSGFSGAMPSLLQSAKGNIFDSPTLHGYSGGIGMLGEAGPEAIMPLKRGADGKLGIASAGGGGGVVQNISVNVSVEGGSNSEDTGNIVSEKIVQVMRGIVKQEIGMDKKRMAYSV